MADATEVPPLSKTLSVERYTLSNQLAIGALPLPWFFTVQLRVTSCPATPAAGPSAVPTRSGAVIVMAITSVLLVSLDSKRSLLASTRRIKKYFPGGTLGSGVWTVWV